MSSLSINIDNISKSFQLTGSRKNQKTVLKQLSFKLNRGETLGIMGESGSGKTTLAKIITGLEAPTSGRVIFQDLPYPELNRVQKRLFHRKVQMLFQNPRSSLNPVKTAARSLKDVLRLIHHPRDDFKTAIQRSLHSVGLSDELLTRLPAQLSGGQNQRMAMARVLLVQPEFIILDEPASALDVSARAQLFALLKSLQKENNLGFLLFTHDEQALSCMTNKIHTLKNGSLVAWKKQQFHTNHITNM